MTRSQRYKVVFILMFMVLPAANGHDGTVNISGTIQDNTCEISPDSQSKIVTLGTVVATQFTFAGERAPAVPFSIHLQNCGPAASEAQVTFSGTPDAQNKDLFTLESGTDSASGVAVGIYDTDGKRLSPGTASAGVVIKPGQASVELAFTARYVSVDDTVKAGIANATVLYEMLYN
ncbi:TPA: fimbrial protein [Enterobacter cancerogenus]|nr:fimbrial protein [Enterobacter cancerogenus]